MLNKIEAVEKKYQALSAHLDERSRRLWAAAEAEALGYGGVSAVSRATGICRRVIRLGIEELRRGESPPPNRIRRPGGGRKPAVHHYTALSAELEKLLEPLSRGERNSPLRWTRKSVTRLAEELGGIGIQVGRQTVATELRKLGYFLQSNRRIREDQCRDAQFESMNAKIKNCLREGVPVISVETVRAEAPGNAEPPGNSGLINIGADHDVAAFAAAAIRAWWKNGGRTSRPKTRRLLVAIDAGGSSDRRLRELQSLADELGLRVAVCLFPGGTRKWNVPAHRLFSFITQNQRGRLSLTCETTVKLIGRTPAAPLPAGLDWRKYPAGWKLTGEERKHINLHPDAFLGEWNYEIRPQNDSGQTVEGYVKTGPRPHKEGAAIDMKRAIRDDPFDLVAL